MTPRAPRLLACLAAASVLAACSGEGSSPQTTGPVSPTVVESSSSASSPSSSPSPTEPKVGEDGKPFTVERVARFDEPWAMTFLPDGRALVTERGGALHLVDVTSGETTDVSGTPEVVHAGQGGLGDVILAPDFDTSGQIYLSWAQAADGGTSGAVVARARLVVEGEPRLDGLDVIWRQQPTTGNGHYGHRLAVSPEGEYLFVSSGERQKFDPAQDLGSNLGKVLRLDLNGTAAEDNPFADRGVVSAQIWSYGHRNPLGLAFDAEGNLWSSEMGPRGGDEVNLIRKGKNYGWPRASDGSHYSGEDIPDHRSGDGFVTPKVSWNPSISPGSLMIYSGTAFPGWQGDAFIGALSGEALIRVDLDGTDAEKADEWPMGNRIREVEQGPDGALWLLEDGGRGRLLKLSPVS